MGVDLETLEPDPARRRQVLARRLLRTGGEADRAATWSAIARGIREVTVPISGIGGIADWRDAVEFMLMGVDNVQVCTAVMRDGFRIVGDMIEGLNN